MSVAGRPARRVGTPTRRSLALGAILAVVGLALAGRPTIPLYDGVIPPDPYRWLQPPSGHPGNPPPVTSSLPVSGGSSPLVAVATPELVPQAQVFAVPGGLVLPGGSTRIDVSIMAVAPPPIAPPNAHVAGNVYAITIVNQAGVAVTANPTAEVSVVLRAPDPLTATASLARWDGTSWQVMPSIPAGVAATFGAVVTQFGEFAIVLPGSETPAPGSPSASGGGSGEPSIQPSLASSPAPTDSGGSPSTGFDRQTLTFVLGGLAVVIVALVAVAALMPSRRQSRDGGRGRGAGRR